jgi:hypothetical protein
MSEPWMEHRGSGLQQGDLLPGCAVPLVGADFGLDTTDAEIVIESRTLIVLTQSCDLQNEKTILAALCPIYSLNEFEGVNAEFTKKGYWETEGLHLLASPEDPQQNRLARVVDFREIFSLPVAYLQRHAEAIESRWRLQSPFLEHFSQAFARFFMRVGLPTAIPPFK